MRNPFKLNFLKITVRDYFGGTPTYFYGTQGFRGIPAENHCSILKTTKIMMVILTNAFTALRYGYEEIMLVAKPLMIARKYF